MSKGRRVLWKARPPWNSVNYGIRRKGTRTAGRLLNYKTRRPRETASRVLNAQIREGGTCRCPVLRKTILQSPEQLPAPTLSARVALVEGRHSMANNKRKSNRLFIESESSKVRNPVYVGASLSAETSAVHVNRLITRAESACGLNDTQLLEAAGRELSLMKGEAEAIGIYYLAVAERRRGNVELSRGMLESVLPELPQRFRARALMSLARTFGDGLIDDAKPIYEQALSESPFDVNVFALASRMLARGNLDKMIRIGPMAEAAGISRPDTLLDYWNELALEFAASGHIEQASKTIEFVLRMPAALQKPNYLDTAEQIERDRARPAPTRCMPGRRGYSALSFLKSELRIRQRMQSWIRKNRRAELEPDGPTEKPGLATLPPLILPRLGSIAPTRGPDCGQHSRSQGSFNRLPIFDKPDGLMRSKAVPSGAHLGNARAPPIGRYCYYDER